MRFRQVPQARWLICFVLILSFLGCGRNETPRDDVVTRIDAQYIPTGDGFTTPEAQAQFSAASGYLPVRISTLYLPEHQDHLASDPGLKTFVDQMSVARARGPIDYGHVEINRHIAEAIERALVGDVDPKVALDEAAKKSKPCLNSHLTDRLLG